MTGFIAVHSTNPFRLRALSIRWMPPLIAGITGGRQQQEPREVRHPVREQDQPQPGQRRLRPHAPSYWWV